MCVFVCVCVVSVEFLDKVRYNVNCGIFCGLKFSLQVTKVGRLSSTYCLYLSIYKIAQNKKFKLHETVRLLT